MKFNKIIVLINTLLWLFSLEAFSQNEGAKKIGEFANWSVYAKSKSLCYMIAQPTQSEGKYNIRGRVRIVVYRNNNNNEGKNVVGIDFGYSFPENSEAQIEIDNDKKFNLSTFGQTAWTGSKTKTDQQIINEMKKGKTLVAQGKSKRGTLTKDIYSLNGFTKAFKEINNYCG